MIKYISSWAQGIIIAVIIASIIEMILPKGNSNKYIKTILGVYILYTITSPVIKFITGKEFKLNNLDYDNFLNNDNVITDVSAPNNIYKTELDKKIKNDIENLGFNVCKVNANLDIEEGILKDIDLLVDKDKSNKGNIVIDKIEIGNMNTENQLNNNEIQEIKEYLCENYSIDIKYITINSK